MTEQEFLKFLNAIIQKVRSYDARVEELTSMTEKFSSIDLDSLEILLVNMDILDAFKVPDEIADSLHATTAKELLDFLLHAHTQMPKTAAEALAMLAKDANTFTIKEI